MTAHILVTGGAGYIGAHVVRLLLERGDAVTVVDDLSTGAPQRVRGAHLYLMDLSSAEAPETLCQVIERRQIQAVVHIAALKQVGESVADPLYYYRKNVGGMLNVLAAMQQSEVRRLVFSSSAAVYGAPDSSFPVDEETLCGPINPYGQTKVVGEWMAKASESAWGLRSVNLRYFNVAGTASVELADPVALNLIPIVIRAVLDGRSPVVFGRDYETRDGTCIRDYVHVADLAAAHIAALDATTGHLPAGSVLNVGTGRGSSVLEVIRMVEEVSGRFINPIYASRRAGDPPELIADVRRIQAALGWRSSLGLRDIVQSAWEAEVQKRRAAGTYRPEAQHAPAARAS